MTNVKDKGLEEIVEKHVDKLFVLKEMSKQDKARDRTLVMRRFRNFGKEARDYGIKIIDKNCVCSPPLKSIITTPEYFEVTKAFARSKPTKPSLWQRIKLKLK